VTRVVARIHRDPPPVRLSSLGDKAQTYGAIVSAVTLAQEVIIRRLGREAPRGTSLRVPKPRGSW